MQDIELEDGSHIVLRKLDRDYDATDRLAGARVIHETRRRGELVTGLLFVDPHAADLCAREKMTGTPLKDLREEDLRIGRDDWQKLFAV